MAGENDGKAAGGDGGQQQQQQAAGGQQQQQQAAGGQQQEAPKPKEGLLSELNEEGEGQEQAKAAGQQQQQTGGETEIPAHLKGKDDAETVTKLWDAYKGARDALAKKGGTAPEKPEDYKFTLGEDLAKKVDLESEASKPVMDVVRAALKANGLSAEVGPKVIADILAGIDKAGLLKAPADPVVAAKESAKSEMAKLNPDPKVAAKIARDEMADLQNLHRIGVFNDNDLAEAYVMAGTADGVRVLQKLRAHYTGHELPVGEQVKAEGVMTVDEARAAFRDPKYQTDPAFRKKADADLAAAVKAQRRVAA